MKTIFALLSLAFFIFAGCQSHHSSNEANRHPWKYISIHGKDRWYPLNDLELKARTYLLDQNMGFADTARETTFWIEDGSTNELLMIHYNSGFGRPFWSVKIDKAGRVIDAVTGILAEGSLSGDLNK